MTRSRRRTLLTLCVLVVILSLTPLGLICLGQWLIVAEPLEPARVIVVFGGQIPFRAMEAAAIFQKGLAPEVWLTQHAIHAEDITLARLGIPVVREDEYSRQVLQRLGVPATAIHLLSGRVDNTAEEISVVSQEALRTGTERVILITSKYHTRRVRYIWHKLVGNHPEAIVRYTPDDPFNPKGWWRHSRDAMAVSREVFGLLNAWAGFPIH